MRLTILRNDVQVPAGHLERVARSKGVDVSIVKLDEGDGLPDPEDVDVVAVLGGEMGAYDTDAHPYLVDEKQFLIDAVHRGVPVLGLCLGCQLLAESLGGAAYLGERPEVAFGGLDQVADDAVVGVLTPGPTLAIHRDTWDLPPGGTLVARSPAYNQAFRYGTALGVQPHPEVDETIVEAWLSHDGARTLVRNAGEDPDRVLEAFRSASAEVSDLADAFFGAWLDEARAALEAPS